MSAEGTKPGPGAKDKRGVDETRRALIRAGWILPVIFAVQLPTNVFAQYAHSDTTKVHTDTDPHSDIAASGHTDIPATTHSDIAGLVHTDIAATLHSDVYANPHIDAASHIDTLT